MVAAVRTALAFLCAFLIPLIVNGMYADQAGSIDWHRENLGEVRSVFQPPAPKRVMFVSTEAGVIAAVNSNKGNIEWRRVLPNTEDIDVFLYQDETLVTLSGSGKTISSWSAKDGAKMWSTNVYSYDEIEETESATGKFDGTMVADLNADGVSDVIVLVHNGVKAYSGKDGSLLWSWGPQKGTGTSFYKLHAAKDSLYAIGVGSKGEIVVTVLNSNKGTAQKTQVLSGSITAPQDNCISIHPAGQLVCLDSLKQNLLVAELRASAEFTSLSLRTLLPESTFQQPALDKSAISNGFVLHTSQDQSVVFNFAKKLQPAVLHSFSNGKRIFSPSDELNERSFVASAVVAADGLQVDVLDLTSGKVELSTIADYSAAEHGTPLRVFLNSFAKKESSETGIKLVVVGSDHSLSLFTGSRLLWTREEALASITHSQIVDFPAELSLRTSLQKEFASDPSANVVSHFVNRIRSEASQFLNFTSSLSNLDVQSVLDHFTSKPQLDTTLANDQFGFKQLIVVATAPGKLFGLHSIDGSLVWSKYLPHAKPTALYVARTSAHPPPHGILVALVDAGETSGTLVQSINLLTGTDLNEEKPLLIRSTVRQSFLLPFLDSSHSHPLICLDSELKVHVYPSTAENMAAVNKHHKKIFFYVVDTENNTIEGYSIDSTIEKPALQLWNINFHTQNEKIEAVATRQPNEAIGSPTLSNPDMSIRPKYINKNALAVATVASVSYVSTTTKKKAYESFVNIYLIDTVTGSIIHRTFFRNAQAPVTLIQSENWLVGHYWNWKLHRYEVSVLEFYEKEMDWDAKTFSSRDTPQLEVLTQSYVFPTGVSTMGVTRTSRGITTKSVLFGLSSDRILALDRRWLSARRISKELLTEQDKAVGIIPYMLKLPTPAVAMINYNRTIPELRGIHTAPAHLESTSLVFAYGTDLFFTRVTPSQTFDLLSDDFQYLPLVATITALVAITIVTTWLVARKNLAKRWR